MGLHYQYHRMTHHIGKLNFRQGNLEKAHFPMSLSESIESNPLIFDINFDGIKEIIIGCNDNKVYAIEPDGSNLTGWPVEGIDDFSAGAAVGDLEHDGDYEVVANTKNARFTPGTPTELSLPVVRYSPTALCMPYPSLAIWITTATWK
jgi:hypothetical protein